MSKELNELKADLRSAAAPLADDRSAVQESSCPEPTFGSSEAAVQAILECLKSNGYLMAIRYIRECRWGGERQNKSPKFLVINELKASGGYVDKIPRILSLMLVLDLDG